MCSTRQRLAGLLREQRTSRGLSLRHAAENAGLAPSTLSRWEAGFCIPRVPELESLLKALGVTAGDVERILASLDTPRAAKALRVKGDDVRACLVAPSGGALLRSLRCKARKSLAEVAHELGVSSSTVSRWEACASHPSEEQFESLVSFLRASEETRRCLIASGIAKLKVTRPPYNESKLAEELRRLEESAKACDENCELHLLQLQSTLWWFRDKPGAKDLIKQSILTYAELLLREQRYKEALQQAQNVLDSGMEGYGLITVRAHRVIARADVYRWPAPRPHLGLYTLQSCRTKCVEPFLLIPVLEDMAEYSLLAGRTSEALEYQHRAILLGRSDRQRSLAVRSPKNSPNMSVA